VLMYASVGNNFDVARYLIGKKVNLEAKDSNGMTALMHASIWSDMGKFGCR